MDAKLVGEKWTLKFSRLRGGNDGYCLHEERKILIHNKLKDKEELETLVHELQHAIDRPKGEEWIEAVALEIADVLWRLGYRRIKELSEE